MPDAFSRIIAFLAVVMALHHGDILATLYFMTGAILVTAVTHLNVRRGLI